MNSVIIFALTLVILFNVKYGLLISQHPKLLVVSFDAFRYLFYIILLLYNFYIIDHFNQIFFCFIDMIILIEI